MKKKINVKKIINISLTLIAISLFLVIMGINEKYSLLTGGMLLFIQLKCINYNKSILSKKENIFILIYVVIFSLFIGMVRDYELLRYDLKDVFSEKIFYLISTLSIFILSFNLFKSIYVYVKNKTKNIFLNTEKKASKKKFLLTWLFIFLLWIPYLVILYPGILSPDSIGQFRQAMTNTYTDHHPLVSTLLLKFATIIGGQNNIGIAVYSVIQMLILSLIFAYFIYTISKTNINKIVIILTFIYFSIFNVHGLYSITIWKDVLYGAFILLLSTKLLDIYLKNFKTTTLDKILLIISVILVGLFRSNGLYVIIALLPFALIIFWKNKHITLLFAIGVIIVIIIKYPVYNSLNIIKGKYIEKVGIPANQIASVVVIDGLEEEDKKLVEQVMPIADIIENYDKHGIDSLKFHESWNNVVLEKNKDEFTSLWIKLGLEYPLTYLKSHLNMTKYFFDVLAENEKFLQHWIYENDYNIQHTNSYEWFEDWNMVIQEFILLMPIYNYALIAWILIFGILINILRKNYNMIFILLLPFLNFTTIMIATPVAMQRRYVYSLYTMLPIIIISVIYNLKKEKTILIGENNK